ncbi:MAG: hypothetical protein HRT88_11385 [Lentisphaeraceae bacterium]|nr:hypothetical protein [Lentisphaeraceae bacterium]
MTPEDYIKQQSAAFIKTCSDMGLDMAWNFDVAEMANLDVAKNLLWQERPAEELGNAVAIMWGAYFSQIIAERYISRWNVDPENKLPILVVKCGNRGIQLKTIILGAQAFNEGKTFVELWKETEQLLAESGAEKK